MSDISDASHRFWTKLTRRGEPPPPPRPSFLPFPLPRLFNPWPSNLCCNSSGTIWDPALAQLHLPPNPSKCLPHSALPLQPRLSWALAPHLLSLQAFALPPFCPPKASLHAGKVWILKSSLTDRLHMFRPLLKLYRTQQQLKESCQSAKSEH